MLARPEDNKLAHQLELERLYNKNQTLQRIRKEFLESEAGFTQHMTEKQIPLSFGYDLLVQMALHKRTTLEILVGILRAHFEPSPDASQIAADMLLKAAEADLVTYNHPLRQFIVLYTLSDDVQAELDRFQYPLPMVVEPRTLRSNSDCAYLLRNESVILKRNHHEEDVCLDHLNRVNKVKFAIDHDTATMIQNRWRNLDKPKAGETKEDFQKRKRAFEKYDKTAKEVITLLVQEGNEFYLTHKYDKRGRIYCQGYHVDYQGAPWNKAVIQLADKEYIDA